MAVGRFSFLVGRRWAVHGLFEVQLPVLVPGTGKELTALVADQVSRCRPGGANRPARQSTGVPFLVYAHRSGCYGAQMVQS